MPENFAGCVSGIVHKHVDMLGRILAYVPVIGEPHLSQPLWPAGFPGSGTGGQGSKYPIKLGSLVWIIFEQGDPTAGGIYFPGGYGEVDGAVDGMTADTEASDADDSHNTTTLWEDANVRMYIEHHPEGQGADARRIVMEDKQRDTYIALDTSAGDSKKSSAVTIKSASAMRIECKGTLDIKGGAVQIQGRRVLPFGDRSI